MWHSCEVNKGVYRQTGLLPVSAFFAFEQNQGGRIGEKITDSRHFNL
jgi:hypothetical protein